MIQEKQDKLIVALVSSSTIKEAADKAGISERTVYSMLKDDSFKTRYSNACADLVTDASRSLQKAVSGAIGSLIDVCNCESTPAQARVNAANVILTQALKFTEFTDILKRLEEIERSVNDENNRQN